MVLLAGEALVVWASFFLAFALQNREPNDLVLVLRDEGGFYKILGVTLAALLFSHWLDLYDIGYLKDKGEVYFRLLLVAGFLGMGLSAVGFVERGFMNSAFLPGLIILTIALFAWRTAYAWLVQQPYLRERVFVLGTGDRARRLVQGLRTRPELGIEVVAWTGDLEAEAEREVVASQLMEIVRQRRVHRVILAMPDRRGTIPVYELLDLRLGGVSIEEATSWLEKMSGRIEVENLYPSWLIFSEGFRFSAGYQIVHRLLSIAASALLLVFTLPVIPFVILAIKLDSRGLVVYQQKRVGRGGRTFLCYKFRTMRQDAEADSGATWATDDDPRITRVGRFLRATRLDEIPQLWCVLKGDMGFVGPRPERPEFVEWLSREIPYYRVRHIVRPGITGWAQVRYKYGNTLDDAREKLQYDLFYIKNASIGLDLVILFQTVKIVMLGRGAQ
jgi:sugar transferase (PEP-CTERM system associated)